MKKKVLALILILIFLAIVVGIVLKLSQKEVLFMKYPYCSDSIDNGRNYFVSGTTTGVEIEQVNASSPVGNTHVGTNELEAMSPKQNNIESPGAQKIQSTLSIQEKNFLSGMLTNSNNPPVVIRSDTCTDENHLKEYYCVGDYMLSENHFCETGCQNGACKCSLNTDCNLVPFQCLNSNCIKSTCGDGLLVLINGNGESEQCDNGSLNTNQPCSPLYNSSCTYCNKSCQSITVPSTEFCGDNQIYPPQEDCDNGTLNGIECSPLYRENCTYCDTTCHPVTKNGEFCGNGIINLIHEECDDGPANTDTPCTPAVGQSCSYCSTNCTNETICENCSSEGNNNGGGGSSGSGETLNSQPQNQNSDLVVVPSELTISLVRDVAVEKEFTIFNRGTNELKLTFSTEQLENFVTFDQNSITLPPNTEKTFKIKILVDKGNQVIVGKIIIKSDTTAIKEIPVIINLRSKDFLFDVTIKIPEKSKIVSQGEKISADVTLLQVGEPKKLDVVASYETKDFSGNSYSLEQETFSVDGKKEYNKEISTEALPAGKYVLGLDIVYTGAFAVSSDQFEVIEQSEVSKVLNKNTLIIIAAAILAIFAAVYLTKKLKKKNLKKRKRK